MPDPKHRDIEIVRLAPSDGRTVKKHETTRRSSVAKRTHERKIVKTYPLHSCHDYKPLGFICGYCQENSYCEKCLTAGRASYCAEEGCMLTLGPCCTRRLTDGRTFCPDHKPFDWGGPLGQAITFFIFFGVLALSVYLLFRFGG